jgi:hypothetical protein
MDNMASIPSIPNLPKWAKPLAKRAEDASERAKKGLPPNDDGLHPRPLNAERITNQLSGMRDLFVSYRNLDEVPGFDQSPGEIGKVTLPNNGGVVHFSGTSLNGTMDFRTNNQVSRYGFHGSQAEHLRMARDGQTEITSVDISNLHRSFSYSTQDPDQPSLEIPRSPYFEATSGGADVLGRIPENSEAALFKKVFLDGSKSMSSVRADFQESLKSGIAGSGLSAGEQSGLQDIFQKLSASTPRRLYQALAALSAGYPDNPKLDQLREKAGFWQAMEDFPKLQADGISRTVQYYVSPGHLALQTAAQGWDIDKESGLPIADSVIVGGGPGGLASAYHLSERGTRTVIFEGGYVGQGFSDAGAKSVHQLRTNGVASNLIYTANVNQLGVDVSMQRHLGENREKCTDAREDWYEACGEKAHGISQARADDSASPANRAELFEHMSHVAHGLAQKYPDTFVCENSPVSTIEKVDRGDFQLFKVKTSQGHEVLARSLVMATGFVGSDGQHARSLSMFEPLEASGVTVLENDNSLFEDNDKLDHNLLVFSERLIGRPEIRNRIEALPEGSRITVVGGGESAVKGALEALHLNPGVAVDLYTSGPMEPYQTQIPASVIAPPITEAAIKDKELAAQTLEGLEKFGTPVTPESLDELLQLEVQGRVRVHEMGKRFSAETVQVGLRERDGEGPVLSLRLTDDEAAASLRSQREQWTALGLYGEHPPADDPTELPEADMVMVAAGYDKRSLRAGPLLQQLIDQDLVEFKNGDVSFGEDGLSSAKAPMISFNTAGAVAFASDTAIPGRAIRAYRLAKALGERLPARTPPTERIESGLPYGSFDTNGSEENPPWSSERSRAFVEAGGTNPAEIQRRYDEVARIEDPAERASAKLRVDADRMFPGPNPTLRALMIRANEAPETLTPSEKVMWQRAQELLERTAG